ncbi:MAG: acetylxylan esterase [Planctomycetaceae bacterium]|nr:acetylxylan esterase [Planctomycetaceae bacterium]
MPSYASDPNYDESKVPEYTLPDSLVMRNGERVHSSEMWTQKRRPEILHLFREEMFGKTPKYQQNTMDSEIVEMKENTLNGKAHRLQIRLYPIKNNHSFPITILAYIPQNTSEKVPAFFALNFKGNQAVTTDNEVIPSISMGYDPKFKGKPQEEILRELTEHRGETASRWPIEMILDRGYAFVTACYYDIDPDFNDGFQNGVHPDFYVPGQTQPAPDEWGSIAAWAWGLSRILDYFEGAEKGEGELTHRIDPQKVAVFGHSRLGKAALWAGASEERFVLVISNNSGCGGAALSKRAFGETVGRINTAFPHWFCENFKKYNENESALPFDQHELIALIAPRPVYIASALEDQWADPKGEFLAAQYASPVYELLGTDGFAGTAEMPEPNHPVGGTIHYHIRTGKHDVTPYDWRQYLDFADKYLKP